MDETGISMKYNEVHQVIGEGNFVLAMSDGMFGDQNEAFYDLSKLANSNDKPASGMIRGFTNGGRFAPKNST